MVKTDIQDYWRQRWGGDKAIPQDNTADGKSRLYGGEGEAAVVWSGTDVLYAKQRENLSKNDFYNSTAPSFNTTTSTIRYEKKAGVTNPYVSTHIGQNIVSGETYTISFDVSDISIGDRRFTLKIYGVNSSFVYVSKVGHISKTFVADGTREGTIALQFVSIDELNDGDYCIIKNLKLEKNIVDSQYSVAPSVTDNRVKIGKHYYHTTQIGNLIWTAENLNEDLGGGTWEGYYNNDPSYGVKGYGKLYTWDAICKANETPSDALAAILPAGWRVPTKADFDALIASVGYSNVTKVKEKWYWPTTGDNDTGFSAIASGFKNIEGQYIGDVAYYFGSTQGEASSQCSRLNVVANLSVTANVSKANAYSVRLVRDAAASNDVTFLNGQST